MERKAFNGWQLKLHDFYFSNSTYINLFLALENLNLGSWIQSKQNVILGFTKNYPSLSITLKPRAQNWNKSKNILPHLEISI